MGQLAGKIELGNSWELMGISWVFRGNLKGSHVNVVETWKVP